MKFNEARKLINFSKKVEAIVGDFYTIAGTEAINHFTQNFRKQGFDDDGVKKWQPRKGEIVGGIAKLRKRERGSRGILIGKGTGNLRKSLIKRRAGKYSVWIISPLPYANIHNEGLNGIAFGKHSFKMPKRQFVGESRKLNKKILRAIDRRVNKAFEFTA